MTRCDLFARPGHLSKRPVDLFAGTCGRLQPPRFFPEWQPTRSRTSRTLMHPPSAHRTHLPRSSAAVTARSHRYRGRGDESGGWAARLNTPVGTTMARLGCSRATPSLALSRFPRPPILVCLWLVSSFEIALPVVSPRSPSQHLCRRDCGRRARARCTVIPMLDLPIL